MSANLNRWIDAGLAGPQVEIAGWALLHFLWQGLAIAVGLGAVLRVLQRAAPNARYAAACAALAVMGACPPATWAWLSGGGDGAHAPRSSTSTLVAITQSHATSGGTTALPISAEDRAAIRSADPATQPAAPAAKPPAAPRGGYLRWVVAAWAVSVGALSVRLCAGWFHLQRLRRRTRPAEPAWQDALRRVAERVRVTRPVRLVESALVEMPSLIGWLRPVILLPASSLTGLAPRELEALLAHELAHIRRHDYLVNLLQTAVETLLFYHPAVWWTSRIIRTEREVACDEIAAAACGNRIEYARALARMEELRPPASPLALAAGGGSLVDRIRRLVGAPAPQAHRSAWWMLAALAVAVVAGAAISGAGSVRGQDSSQQVNQEDGAGGERERRDSAWGDASNGLQLRLIPVSRDIDDETPDPGLRTDAFASADDVTFAVELRNASDAPITVLGVRYGDSYGPASGRLNAESMVPHLFRLEVTDGVGAPLARPAREFIDPALQVDSTSMHALAPGESLVVTLRPATFHFNMDYRLPPGDYRLRVRYVGMEERVRERLQPFSRRRPQLDAWSGDAISNAVEFTVAGEPVEPAELAWGEPVDGLRAAVTLRPRGSAAAPDDPPGTVPLDCEVDATLHFQNVSDAPISLSSESWRQDDRVAVTNDAGESRDLRGWWYTGWPVMLRWTLKPGEIAEISAVGLAVVSNEETAKMLAHPVGCVLNAIPGQYTVRYTSRLPSFQRRDREGNVVVPGPNDWKGTLTTGEMPLVVRKRTPADDERAAADRFTARVEFVGPDGSPVSAGTFTVRTALQQGQPDPIAIHAGPIDVPDVTRAPVTIAVRAPGFEERRFGYVTLSPRDVRQFELEPAAAARFRLVSAVDGQPVAGAKVRYFNKNSDLASGGPFPSDGIEGPVWATSDDDGQIVLDSLQRIDPSYPSLGDAVYFFYVDADGFPGRFVGGVKAGQNLGEVTLGPALEVRGEIRGTAEELERFAAEWDQPFHKKTAKSQTVYAVSQRLPTQREGDKLTFLLAGLRPGPLRIIMNFSPHPHSVSHTYGRRDPQGSDVLVELDLTESIADLVLTPRGRE